MCVDQKNWEVLYVCVCICQVEFDGFYMCVYVFGRLFGIVVEFDKIK